jgi:hypothetical protein
MATTTNFGWETPDDTDLVKDGALAMRTLGNAIDTSLVDLKGGTTGQNLRKNSNTDMDFVWAGDATNTVIDAAGDLLYGTAADTLGRLALGTAGQVLTVNSGATAPEWKTSSGGTKNYSLLNSGGTSLSGSSTTVSSISGMDNLYIAIIGASCTAADIEIQVQINADSGANYTAAGATYVWGSTYSASNYNGGGGYSNGTQIEVGRMSSGASTSTVSAGIWINGANTSGEKFYHSFGGGTATSSNGQRFYHNTGMWENAATVSSIKVIASGGTFDAGTVYVWGSA